MYWTFAAVIVWVVITVVAIAFGRAAAKPWPERNDDEPR